MSYAWMRYAFVLVGLLCLSSAMREARAEQRSEIFTDAVVSVPDDLVGLILLKERTVRYEFVESHENESVFYSE